MFTVNYADGYYIEYNGEGIIDLVFDQDLALAEWVCHALNMKEELKEYRPIEELLDVHIERKFTDE